MVELRRALDRAGGGNSTGLRAGFRAGLCSFGEQRCGWNEGGGESELMRRSQSDCEARL